MSELDPQVQRLGLEALAAISALRDVLLERFPEHFGGLNNIGDSLAYVVLTVGDDGDLREFTSAHLAEFTSDDPAIAARLPTVVFQPAARARPLRQLVDLQDRIVADWQELRNDGIVVSSVGVRDDANRLEVSVLEMDESIERTLVRRYGDDIEILVGWVTSHQRPGTIY